MEGKHGGTNVRWLNCVTTTVRKQRGMLVPSSIFLGYFFFSLGTYGMVSPKCLWKHPHRLTKKCVL